MKQNKYLSIALAGFFSLAGRGCFYIPNVEGNLPADASGFNVCSFGADITNVWQDVKPQNALTGPDGVYGCVAPGGRIRFRYDEPVRGDMLLHARSSDGLPLEVEARLVYPVQVSDYFEWPSHPITTFTVDRERAYPFNVDEALAETGENTPFVEIVNRGNLELQVDVLID